MTQWLYIKCWNLLTVRVNLKVCSNIVHTFTGYITNVLEDAKVYSEHAKKKEIDVSDVQLAIEAKMNHSFTPPPPREASTIVMKQLSSLCLVAIGSC